MKITYKTAKHPVYPNNYTEITVVHDYYDCAGNHVIYSLNHTPSWDYKSSAEALRAAKEQTETVLKNL